MPPKKTKKAQPVPNTSTDLIKQLNHTPSWPATIEVVRRRYHLPDLSSRKGLKECNRNIHTISKTLLETFDNQVTSPRLRGGIIGIWGKLAYDAVLRDKLVPEGILPRIVSMMNHPETTVIVLQTLATITRHGGLKARHDVARIATPDIVKILQDNPTSSTIAHLAVPILAHTISTIYTDLAPTYRQFPSIKMADVLQATYDTLANVPLDFSLFSHGQELILSSARHAYAQLENHQPSLDYVVATLRCTDLRIRSMTLLGLLTFHIHHHKADPRHVDAMQKLAAIQNIPRHLQTALVEYGWEKSDFYLWTKAVTQFSKAQQQAAQTRDFFELGLRIGEILTLTEGSVIEGSFGGPDGQPIDLGLPYTTWVGSLPVAAIALRQRDPVKYADMADMIDVRYFMLRRSYAQIRERCEAAMKRSKHAYWYYMRANAEAAEEGDSTVRWAKLGLKCKETSNYLRFGLLELSANAASNQALDIMAEERGNPGKWSLGLALLHSALDDSMTFAKEAPPDSRGMRDMATMAMLMTVVLKGKDLSPDMHELKPICDKLKLADEFSAHMANGEALTQWRRSYNTIAERYERAANFWDIRLEGCNKPKTHGNIAPGDKYERQDDLAKWFATMILEDGRKVVDEGCGHDSDTTAGMPFIDGRAVDLYQCTFCQNPSASLKKCSGCASARYCDSNCQRNHWKAHKAHCGVKAS